MEKLLLLLLLILSFQAIHAQNYTKGNVYDFNIGDEFHYQNRTIGPNPPTNQIDRVLNRYTNSTHLFYEIGDISLTNASVVLSTRIDSIALSELSDPVVDTITSGIFADTLATDSIIVDSILCHHEYLFTNSTLDVPDGFEPPHWLQQFVLGLGEVYYYRVGLGGFVSKSLVYYKKDNITCGAPVYITSTQALEQSTSVKIAPNPFTDQIYIHFESIPLSPVQFSLYNNLGQLVLEKTIQEQHYTNISIDQKLEAGIYYGVLHYNNLIQTVKLIKQ